MVTGSLPPVTTPLGPHVGRAGVAAATTAPSADVGAAVVAGIQDPTATAEEVVAAEAVSSLLAVVGADVPDPG